MSDRKNLRRAGKKASADAARIATTARAILAHPESHVSAEKAAHLGELVDLADTLAVGDPHRLAATLIERAQSGALDSRTARAVLEMTAIPAAVKDACRALLIERGERLT